MNRFLCALAAVVLAPQVLLAQSAPEPEEERVSPDQRDFTTSTGITPRGRVQIEVGAGAERRGSEREYSPGEGLVRVPVSQRAEVRLGIPSYLIQRENGRQTGLDDTFVEARFQLSKSSKRTLGLQLGTTLPIGSRRVAERRYQPEAVLAATLELSPRAELVVNGAARRASESGQRFTQLYAAASLRYDWSKKLNVLAEVYAFNREEARGPQQKFAALAATYYFSPRTALYVRGGVGLGNDVGGPDYLYGTGLSRLF